MGEPVPSFTLRDLQQLNPDKRLGIVEECITVYGGDTQVADAMERLLHASSASSERKYKQLVGAVVSRNQDLERLRKRLDVPRTSRELSEDVLNLGMMRGHVSVVQKILSQRIKDGIGFRPAPLILLEDLLKEDVPLSPTNMEMVVMIADLFAGSIDKTDHLYSYASHVCEMVGMKNLVLLRPLLAMMKPECLVDIVCAVFRRSSLEKAAAIVEEWSHRPIPGLKFGDIAYALAFSHNHNARPDLDEALPSPLPAAYVGFAVESADLSRLEYVLARGADPCADNNLPFLRAVSLDAPEMVHMLMAHGVVVEEELAASAVKCAFDAHAVHSLQLLLDVPAVADAMSTYDWSSFKVEGVGEAKMVAIIEIALRLGWRPSWDFVLSTFRTARTHSEAESMFSVVIDYLAVPSPAEAKKLDIHVRMNRRPVFGFLPVTEFMVEFMRWSKIRAAWVGTVVTARTAATGATAGTTAGAAGAV
jgi:hypothetical protein